MHMCTYPFQFRVFIFARSPKYPAMHFFIILIQWIKIRKHLDNVYTKNEKKNIVQHIKHFIIIMCKVLIIKRGESSSAIVY